MLNLISVIKFTCLLTLISLSPFPSIPFVMLNYKVNGLLLGYLITLFTGTITSLIQYKLARKYIRRLFSKKTTRKYKLIIKYSKLISGMNYFEFILLLFIGFVPNSIISYSSGFAKIKLKKFLLCYVIVGIPQQLLFVLAACQIDSLSKNFNKLGFSNIYSVNLSISIISLILFIILYLIKNYLKRESINN